MTGLDQRFDALLKAMAELELRLRQADQQSWVEWIETDRRRIASGDRYGLDHFLSAFGGMGSLNDISVSPETNELRARCWSLAREIQRELNPLSFGGALSR